MAAFDDPSWFEDSILNFDPNHFAPLPPQMLDYNNASSGSGSGESNRSRNSLSPMSMSGPPSLHHTATTSESSPRSYGTGSPASSSFLNTSFSESELDDLLNYGAGGGGGMTGMDDYAQRGQAQGQGQNPLFLPPAMFGGFDFTKMMAAAGGQQDPFGNLNTGMFFQPPQQQQQLLQPQQQPQQQQQQTMAPQWMQTQTQHQVQPVTVKQEPQQPQPEPLYTATAGTSQTPPPAPAATAAPKPAAKRGPKPKKADKDDPSSSSAAPGGKHNKTERRYRQKVQAAQSDLRDAVPALRVLYGTSTDEQKRTTDIKAADGSVDGLGEITRPNASAKTTIFVGARMYIELLQQRVASQQRRIDELEQYRSAVGGESELEAWKTDFESRESVMREMLKAAAAAASSAESEEDEEEEEEEEEPTPPPAKRKRGRKPKQQPDESVDSAAAASANNSPTAANAGAAVRVFAAFAMTFSFLPSADKTFTSVPLTSAVGPLSDPSTGQVISQLPIITAEHASRLLARTFPAAAVPGPSTIVEWTWRLFVGVAIALILGRLSRSRVLKPWARGRGVWMTVTETAKYACRVESPTDPRVLRYAETLVGRSVSSAWWTRWYTILHLHRTATSDAYALAMLALVQPHTPFLPSSDTLWKQARASVTESTPPALVTVLDLSLAQVHQYLRMQAPVSGYRDDPIGAVADQVHLGHLDDLFAQLFTKIVIASTTSPSSSSSATGSGGPLPSTTTALRENLLAYKIGQELKSSAFDLELRRTIAPIPRGTTAHALSLVLIGLWGVLAGSAPSAQASLATALAAAEMSSSSSSSSLASGSFGASGQGLSSVSAMLNLLYPGTSSPAPAPAMLAASPRARALDKMALVCIEYLRLIIISPTTGGLPAETEGERAKRIATITTNLRLALTQTETRVYRGTGSGVDGPLDRSGASGDKATIQAKERLVGVLSAVGRRAAGRMMQQGQGQMGDDSGLDAEVDEL